MQSYAKMIYISEHSNILTFRNARCFVTSEELQGSQNDFIVVSYIVVIV